MGNHNKVALCGNWGFPREIPKVHHVQLIYKEYSCQYMYIVQLLFVMCNRLGRVSKIEACSYKLDTG